MPICAVCGKNNDTLVCKSCGFDGSCDYEKYPSLGRPAKRPDPVSARRAALKAGNDDALRCPKCGSTQFSVAMDAGKFICTGCGHRFPMPGVPSKPQTPPAAKSTTSTPVSKPAASTPPVSKPAASTPPVSKPAASTPPVSKPAASAPPASKPTAPISYPTLPAKTSSGFLVRLTLTLGWFAAGFVGFALADGFLHNTDLDSMSPLAAFLGLVLIMQLRLIRKGFCPLFGSKIPYGLHNFCYIFMALDFTVAACVGFCFVTDSTTQFIKKDEWLTLVALVAIMPLYFAFWALGQRSSRKKK